MPSSDPKKPIDLVDQTRPATSRNIEVKNAMKTELPGVSVHRGLFWRYVAIWTAPVR